MHTESIQSLAHRLREAQRSGQQRFIFFLGAGASHSSGIPIASWMTRDFERKLQEIWGKEPQPRGDFLSWLQSKPGWKNNESDYARYFEAYEPTEIGRRHYLNKWMAAATPSWGYFCLAQLLAQSYINTIVTANFDDLIYDSCTQYSARRPRVYSTFIPYASVEHDHNRPTIIKLHGDYLYANFKNTEKETTQQVDQRLMDDVQSLFQRHEVIVAGYSGNDQRIMDELLQKVPLTNAVYWCTYKDNPLPQKVKEIVSNGHSGHWFTVRTEGFDELMDALVHELEFSIPSILQPIQSLIDAIPGRIEGSQSLHVRQYFEEAIQQIREEEQELARAHEVESIPPTPYRLRLEAANARLNLEFDRAIEIYKRLVGLPKQDTCEVLIEYAVTLELMGNYAEANAQTFKIEDRLDDDSDTLGNYGWLLANLGRYDDGIKYFRRAIAKGPGFNQWPAALAMILSEDGRVTDASDYARELTDLNPDDGPMWAARSMIESLAGNYETTALEYAYQAVKRDPTGFNENLALAFALSGKGDHMGAIDALEQIEGEQDEIYYRCLGHFQILAGDSDSSVESLQQAIDITKLAKRPKILALYGVALLAQGSKDKAQETFELASSARDSGRHYKADDELAFALCEIGAGRVSSGESAIKTLSSKYRQMRGLLAEFSALLAVMQGCGVDGCGRCIASITEALQNEGT